MPTITRTKLVPLLETLHTLQQLDAKFVADCDRLVQDGFTLTDLAQETYNNSVTEMAARAGRIARCSTPEQVAWRAARDVENAGA